MNEAPMYQARLTDKFWRGQNQVRVFAVTGIDTQRNDLRVRQVDGLGERTATIHASNATDYHKGDLLDVSVWQRGATGCIYQLHGRTPSAFIPQPKESEDVEQESATAEPVTEESLEAGSESEGEEKPRKVGRPRKAS